MEDENRETSGHADVLPISGSLLLPNTDVTLLVAKGDASYAGFAHSTDRGNRPDRGGDAEHGSYMEHGVTPTTVIVALPLKQGARHGQLADDDFYRTGVILRTTAITEVDGGLQIQAQAGERVGIRELHVENDHITCTYVVSPTVTDLDEKGNDDILGYIRKVVHEIASTFRGGDQFERTTNGYTDVDALIAYLARYMPLSAEDRYGLLKSDSLKERSLLFIDMLIRQRESLDLNMRLSEKFSEEANRRYREQVLRAQLKAIEEELDSGEEDAEDLGEDSGAASSEDGDSAKTGSEGRSPRTKKGYRARIDEAGMPDEVRAAALEEVGKLDSSGPEGMEQSVIRNYLDFMLDLPWKREEATPIDLKAARGILDERHFGLEKVKDRIIQHLAVMQLKGDKKGSVLLLVGPPGTGKTSLGKSIAEALGRKYIRMSLGGIRDEAEIRGHRRTYVGAMPGRVLESIKRAGVTNPVMVLDEVDKLMPGGFSGDPQSALLEVLDPEQNNSFTDHYLDLPYDLSDVFFIATANSLDTIPAPLLDRMEVIQISGYTPDEKFHIGREHLIPEVLQEHGITADQLEIDDDILRRIIEEYTVEAGVRGLKKQLAALARVASEKIVEGEGEMPYIVDGDDLEKALGRRVSRHERAQDDNPPGVVTGLAWTPVGGEILFIETTDMPGSGEVTITGQLGDVMQESARISLSLLKSRLPLGTAGMKDRDLHIHVPSGAVQKDGPSAGIALFTALASLATGIKVDPKLAMTGEITLRGVVMPIGGLKEKLLAAQRAGIRRVLIPDENVPDLKDVPDEVKDQLQIVPVLTVEDVLRETIGIELPRIEHVLMPSERRALPVPVA